MAKHQFKIHNIIHTRSIVLISLGVQCLLFYFYYYPDTKVFLGDESRYYDAGLSIIAGGDWHSNPLWPPMQSVLISLFARLFEQPLLPLQIFQYMMLLLAGFIVRDLTWRETQHQASSQISLAIMLWYPSWLAYSQYLWPEVIHVLLLVAIIWINHYKKNAYGWMAFSGLLLGLMILFKSVVFLFIPFLYLPLIVAAKRGECSWPSAFMKITLSMVIAVAVISPASIKAHKLTGGWMVSNSSMFNLWYGLNDDKRQHFAHDIGGGIYRKYMSSADDYAMRNHLIKEQAMKKIDTQGFVTTTINQLKKQYFRLFDHQSFFTQQFQGPNSENFKNKYHHHHDEILVKTVVNFDHIFYFFIMLGMVLGLLISIKKSLLAQQFGLFLLYTLGLFILLHAKSRFRVPLMPMMAFFSGLLCHYMSRYDYHIKTVFVGIRSRIIVIAIIILVACLVFAGELLDKIFPI